MNHVWGTSQGFSPEQKKMEPESRLETTYSMGSSLPAAGQGADTIRALLKARQCTQPEHKWSRTVGRAWGGPRDSRSGPSRTINTLKALTQTTVGS